MITFYFIFLIVFILFKCWYIYVSIKITFQEDFYHYYPDYRKIPYVKWYTSGGEPTGGGQNCISLQRTFGTVDSGQFYFADEDCLEEKPYICVVGSMY